MNPGGESDPLAQLDAPPIFVGGHERSGTTWVFDLLTAHPAVAGLFETWMFSPLHGIGGVFAEEQWDPARVRAAADEVGRPFGLHQMIGRDELLEQVRGITSDWMGRTLRPEHRFIVEKTPPHLLGMDLLAEIHPGARFIHVVRDGRDVAISIRAAAKSWNPGLRARSGRSFGDDARSWGSVVKTISAAGERQGQNYTEVRYEDLHADTKEVVARLFSFCGIPADARTLERIAEAARFDSHADTGGDAFRRAGRIGDWRRSMSALDALRFERAAGEVLIERGYESKPGWWKRQLGARLRATDRGAR